MAIKEIEIELFFFTSVSNVFFATQLVKGAVASAIFGLVHESW